RRSPDKLEVTLAYVEPSSRKQGVFTQLLAALRKRNDGPHPRLPISVTPYKQNELALAVLGKLKAEVAGITYDMR
ncbi:hypothetical protein, partial [Shinella sp.]|uniref:hypothetical protein n=1 Tax=Shinella sp. TaxID=1870904 RepID=UPI0039E61079